MPIIEKEVTIINKLGLHARAATKLAQVSQRFMAKIVIELEGNKADAESVMGLMLLAGGQGKKVKVIAEGDDAEQAVAQVCDLINGRFDEEE